LASEVGEGARPSDGFSVRRADLGDALHVLDCLRAAFEPYRDAYTPQAFADTVPTPLKMAERLAETAVFVAVSPAGEILGTVGGRVVDEREGHLRGMAVRPACEGSGVARRLLEVVEDALVAGGCSRITLDTTAPLRRAVRFYERNGYRRSGVVRDFFGMPLFEYVKTIADVDAPRGGAAER
jgi:ribosomal protein S18 acetylase RimI-like enzyme